MRVGVGEGGRAKRQGVQETKRKQRCYGSETRLRLTCWALSPYPPLNEARAENVKQQHADGAERCLVTAPVVPAGGVRRGWGRTKTAVGILAPPHYSNSLPGAAGSAEAVRPSPTRRGCGVGESQWSQGCSGSVYRFPGITSHEGRVSVSRQSI